MGKLDNKVAIVTGASAGMGKEIAKLYAKEGATVIALARRKERLDEVASEADGTIVPFPADITNADDIAKVFDLAINDYGKIDILVNNAGIMDGMTSVGNLTDEMWDNVINVNLTALMKFSRRAVQEMLKVESGVIVNVASVGGLKGGMAGAAYVASKHGVVGLTKNIAYQYATKGIRCNAICPGGVETEIGEVGMANADQFGMEKAMLGMGTMPRQGQPEEIASVALFLASDDSSFVNGTLLTADAGWTAY